MAAAGSSSSSSRRGGGRRRRGGAGAAPTLHFDTLAIHAGQSPEPVTGAVMTPVFLTSTYAQKGPGEHSGFEYSRTQNPTRFALEGNLAGLEGGAFGLCFNAGLAASTAVLSLLSAGDEVVAGDDLYGGSFRLFEKVFQRLGLRFVYADARDPRSVAAAITPRTRLCWIETPTNPLLRLADIRAIAAICRPRGVLLAVDNTFMSPYFQRPLALGADLVVHSTTKYLNGHSDIVGGAVVVRDGPGAPALRDRLAFLQNAMGGSQPAFDSFMVLRGTKTLAVRMRRHQENALRVARWLETRREVARVVYPGLRSHPQHALARRQMSGYGGMVSFEHASSRARAAARAAPVRVRRIAGRRRVAGRAPRDHDPRLDPAHAARGAGHQRRAHPPVGRHRGCRRSDRRSVPGAGARAGLKRRRPAGIPPASERAAMRA
jgi:cystathionine gamma-lyase